MPLNSYKEVLSYLYDQLPMFHRIGAAAYKANLDNTHKIMQLLNHPEQKFKCVHVAGTNGKGSTSHMLASVLQTAGYKTGLYTSPHLKDFRERIRINGKMISKKTVVDFVNQHHKQFEIIKPSFFEWTVGLAFHYFQMSRVDIAIIETGLGGRLDSTNVIKPLVSVITNIGWDHTALLGNSLEKIAAEKAGIIKKNIPVVIGTKQKETERVFDKHVKAMHAPLWLATDHYRVKNPEQVFRNGRLYFKGDLWSVFKKRILKKMFCDLPGLYQQKNIPPVCCVAEILKKHYDFEISESALLKGIQQTSFNTGLKGRWQVIAREPLTICDVAHNEDGIKEILLQLQYLKYRQLHIVIGMVSDKDVTGILALLPRNASYYFCRANIPRALDSDVLKQQANEKGLHGKTYRSVKMALKAAKNAASVKDLVLVTGSIFTVSEVVK